MLLIALVSLFAFLPGVASAAEVPADADYSEEYIPSSSPVPNDNDPKLHVDVMRPKGASGKVPVIMTVSPYTNHSQSGGATYDPEAQGPSDRFFDFMVRDAQVFKKGYAYVIVDLRGTGGSAGCHDWGGPGEQDDVKRAVEWAASQPWSNGKVALYGKSYDGWTGIMGLAKRPKGLAAVISQEPVVDGYRYFWNDGVRVSNTFGTPASFQLFDVTPGSVFDSPEYNTNSAFSNAVRPGCNAQNAGTQSTDGDHESAYWKPRNLVPLVKGAEIPTFLMAGFLEDNTKPDAIFETFNNLAGTKNRAWYGQWDHIRGNDRDATDPKKFAAGRETFVEESMRFLDEHLKGVAPSKADPVITVQSDDGKFRSEAQWPPVDARTVRTTVKGGTYTDNGQNNGDGSGAGKGIWTISQPLPYDAHLAGVQRMTVEVTRATMRSNLVANLYEISPNKKATAISRDTTLLNGPGNVALELYGQDWIIEKGNRIGVLLSPANAEWWRHVATNQPVDVKSATIDLPFLAFKRGSDLSGGGTKRLTTVKGRAFDVPDEAFKSGATSFTLPPEQVPFPEAAGPATGSGAPGTGVTAAQAAAAQRAEIARRKAAIRRKRLTVTTRALRGRRLLVRGRTLRGSVLTVKVKRGTRVVARRKLRTRTGAYRVIVRLPRRGRYGVTVSSKPKNVKLISVSRRPKLVK